MPNRNFIVGTYRIDWFIYILGGSSASTHGRPSMPNSGPRREPTFLVSRGQARRL